MAPSKQKCRESQHLSCSIHRPPVRTRSICIPPAHREPLVTPRHTIIISRRRSVMEMNLQVTATESASRTSPWIGPVRRPSQTAIQVDISNDFHEWLSPWCQEPPEGADVNACCWGFWIPCALFGKTDWRLRNASLGGDASDAKWTSANGCNGVCWSYFCLCFWCGPGIAGLMTVMQRTRIRGTYGIQGTVLQDCCRGYWCPACTQIQNDREVRAREGDQKLRYNKKYLANRPEGHVNTQPPPPAPMTYAPSQPASQQTVKIAPSLNKPNKLQKSPPNVEEQIEVINIEMQPLGSSRVGQNEAARQTGEQQSNTKDRKEKNKTKSGDSVDKESQQVTQDKNHDRKDHGEAKSTRTKPQSAISDIEVSTKPVKNSGGSSSSAQNNISAIQDKSKEARLTQEHTIVDCVVIESEIRGKDQRQLETHLLVDCTVVEVEDKKISTIAVAQHSVDDCHRASSSSDDPHDLSYHHDFTDCPIDKKVLEYYERSGKRIEQHSLSDDAQVSSSITPGWKIQQHSLSDDPRASTSAVQGRSVQQHSLSDDLRASTSTVGQLPGTSYQHTVSECLDANQANSSKTGRQYRSASSDHTVTNSPSGLKEHRLTSCPPGFAGETSTDQSGVSDGSQENQTNQKSFTSSKSKKRADAVHKHDENCLRRGLHHKCALNFDITTSDNAAATSDNKKHRLKGIRNANSTKTRSSSNNNKSTRSTEKPDPSAHSQTSSGSGKKGGSRKDRVDKTIDVIGFPYSESEEVKIKIGGSKVHPKQFEERIEIVVTEGTPQNEEEPSGFWSKITGSGKGKEPECHT